MRGVLVAARAMLVWASLLAGSPDAEAVEYHTSPECWEGPRIHQAGPVPEEQRSSFVIDRVPLRASCEPMVQSDNGAYGFSITRHEAEPESSKAAYVEVLIDNERDYLIRLSAEDARGLEARWINESWLFVRVWWGRIAGSDVIFDVEDEGMLHQAQILWGQIAFEQYKQACGGVCPCDHPGTEQD